MGSIDLIMSYIGHVSLFDWFIAKLASPKLLTYLVELSCDQVFFFFFFFFFFLPFLFYIYCKSDHLLLNKQKFEQNFARYKILI